MRDIGVLGAGRFAQEIELYARRLGIKVIHFFDGTNPNSRILKNLCYCMGVGSPMVKNKIIEQSGCNDFISIYDVANIYGLDVEIGKGCVICPGVYLTANVKLGNFVTLNINSTIGHDSVLGDFTNVAPGASVSGNVVIGKNCDIGTNAAIRQKVTICDDVILGLNCGVVKDITEPGTYVGTPARKIK